MQAVKLRSSKILQFLTGVLLMQIGHEKTVVVDELSCIYGLCVCVCRLVRRTPR